jgi:hypothetical protein
MLLHHVNVGEFVGWGGVFFFSGRDAPRVTNSGLLADVCGGAVTQPLKILFCCNLTAKSRL